MTKHAGETTSNLWKTVPSKFFKLAHYQKIFYPENFEIITIITLLLLAVCHFTTFDFNSFSSLGSCFSMLCFFCRDFNRAPPRALSVVDVGSFSSFNFSSHNVSRFAINCVKIMIIIIKDFKRAPPRALSVADVGSFSNRKQSERSYGRRS